MASTTTDIPAMAAMNGPSVTDKRGRRSLAPRRFTQGYSRFVHIVKLLLPVGAVVLLALVALWPQFAPDDLRFRIGFAAIKAGLSGDPSMVNPRYVGTDQEDQPYAVTAELARSLSEGTAKVELDMPKADITLDDGTWLVLTAETGVFARAEKTLDLQGAVNLYHDSGYEFRTESAAIDLAKGSAVGNVPVVGQGPFGNLEAQGFRLVDKGKTIYFTGKSKLILFSGDKKATQ